MANFLEVIFKIFKTLPLFETRIKKNTFLFEEKSRINCFMDRPVLQKL